MSAQASGGKLDCVAIDLNTQRDFCDCSGAYPVRNVDRFVTALRMVVEWTRVNRIPVISSMDSHRKWELDREGVPPHCIEGSLGQRKLEFTLLEPRTVIEWDNTLSVPHDLFQQYCQVIFRKRTHDLFANPKADRFLTQLPVREYLIFGTGMESSVKSLTLGLLARHKKVCVVTDACGFWNHGRADLALRQIEAKGARLIHARELEHRRIHHRFLSLMGDGNGHADTNGRTAGRLMDRTPGGTIPSPTRPKSGAGEP